MEFKKKLMESKAEDPEVLEFMERSKKEWHPFTDMWMKNYEKALKEGEPEIGALKGVGDVGATPPYTVYPTLEIFNAVIRGFTRYMDDTFVRKYVTDKVVFKVPLTEYTEGVSLINPTTGQFAHTEKKIDYATVNLDNTIAEHGGKVTWTRSLLEDITFDVQAEMMEGLGHAIAVDVMRTILTELRTGAVWEASHGKSTGDYLLAMPYGGAMTIANPSAITWKEFLDVVGIVDRGIPVDNAGNKTDIGNAMSFKTYGPADFCLVSPDIYWQLLNIIQMTNVLYEGSTDPVKKGVIKLALGVTIVKQSLLPQATVIALNSEKAIALVTRRQLKIEPVLFPVWNEYGFIGTIRLGTTAIFPEAIQLAKKA